MQVVSEIIVNKWEIMCAHTPETVDRIMINFRKRGLLVNTLVYEKIDEFTAKCVIEFEETPLNSSRIFSNMQRIYDIQSIKRLS